jgi:ATP:ADP antiporter, AAA family
MLRRFERVLDLRPGELERGVLLFAYLFLVMGSFVTGKAVRDAMFLDEFGALLLPYADIAVALLVFVWVAAYLRISGRVTLPNLIVGSLLFFAVNCLLFRVLSMQVRGSWLTPVIYIWVGMFGVVAPAQVWTLANYVLTTREAKRLYGFIGSGGIAGWIVGGYVTGAAVRAFGAESTLVGMAVALLLSAGIVVRLWQRRQISEEPKIEADEPSPSIRTSVKMIWASPYLTAIAAVVLLSQYTTAIAAWQFKAVSSHAYIGKDELAAFFGTFNFYAGLIAFGVQWLVTGRLLRKLGLAFALFVVPVGLTLGSLGLLTFKSLAAVIVLRGIDQVLRNSIDRPSVELLYLPVPADQTLAVKSFIDTVIWRLGDGLLAGATILLAASWGRMGPVQVTWVNLVLLGCWMAAAWVAQRQYVQNLQDSIQNYRLDTERATTTGLERSATELLSQHLKGDAQEVLYALRVLGAGRSKAMHPAVRGLLAHPSAEVRAEAIRVLDDAGDGPARAAVEKALYDPDLYVRTQALLYIAHHTQIDPLDRIEELGDFQDFSIRAAMVTFLAQPGAHENLEAARMLLDRMLQDESSETRQEAARLLELLPDRFEDQIGAVLDSKDVEQVKLAIRAVGRLKKRKFAAKVISRLGDPELTRDAADAVAAFGDRVVGTLRDDLTDPETSVDVRREIPNVLFKVGTQAAAAALAESMLDADPQVRFRVISALNKLQDLHPSWPVDARLLETILGAEIMGHLRSYQIIGTLDQALGDSTPIASTLQEGMDKELERIFRLLKLLHPNQDLHSAYVGVQSDNRVVHDNALEFLENILGPQLRALLVPLLDGDVSIGQRVGLANRVLGTRVNSQAEAIESLLASEDPWLRSCAAYAIGTLHLQGYSSQLSQMAQESDPLLRETALQAQTRLREA